MSKQYFDEKKLREEFEIGKNNFRKDDLGKVLQESEKVKDKVKSSSILSKQWAKVKLLLRIIDDYMEGRYNQIPWTSIAAVGVTLIYILNPFDIIPDLIPFIGYIDDASLLGVVWEGIMSDVKKYADWKSNYDREIKELSKEAFK